LHGRSGEQALTDRQVDHVTDENPRFFGFGERSALDQLLLGLLIREAPVEGERQVDTRVAPEPELRDLVLQ
jgi:hypothetical protein